MYGAFWIGLVVCAWFGYRTDRIREKNVVLIVFGDLVSTFFIRETAAKRMIAAGMADHNPPFQWVATVFGITLLWWSLAFLVLMWLGSRRRLKAAIDAAPESKTTAD